MLRKNSSHWRESSPQPSDYCLPTELQNILVMGNKTGGAAVNIFAFHHSGPGFKSLDEN